MSEELFTYSEVQNLGFFTNPNLQDSKLKAMSRREQLMQGAYYYANSDRDDECRNKSAEIFGRGTIPLSDKENSAYFLGHAVLLESGYTGSPFEYFLQQDMDLPPEVTDEDTARIYIGNKVLNDMRAIFDKNKQDETILADVQNDLSGFLAPLVRMPSGYQGQPTDKNVADALNRMGVWDKISPSVDRARIAWLRMQHLLQDVDHMQEAGRPELAELANVLSDDKGQLDEMAVLAFYSAVEQHAKEKQSDDSQFWATFSNSFENFIDRAIDEDAKERAAQIAGSEAYQQAIKSGAIEEQAMQAAEAAAKATGYNDPRVERMRGIMQSAMHTAMEPSEQASMFAKIGTGSGRLFGDSIIPMAGAIAATALTKGRGIGLIGQAAAGWAGGLAVSKDSIINQAVAQAYLEGVENPEEYGYYAGLGQAAAENIAGVGTTGFMAFKGINRLMGKAAAKATTSKVLSNAYARATLALGATMGIEGTTELAEEEIGEALGSMLNSVARATGSNVSEQKYEPLKAIKQMKPHQIASMYVFAGALGFGGAVANFAAAQEMSIDIGKLKAAGYSDKKAREVQAHGIETARKIEEVSNSNATAEEKKAQITAIQDERLEYLGKTFREDVANASNEELVKRSKEENAEFTYRSLLAWAIQNQLDEQALIDLGYMSAKRQPNGNYLLTYEEKGEGENAQPKFVQKEWNRDQLHGFMLFQRGTDVHMKLRELSGQLMAMQFAEKVASVEELKIQLANLRDTPITELATIMQHEAITPELFKAFAEKEAANIAADIAQGMTRQQAEMEPSKLLPGVARKDVIQTATAAEERKQNAIAKGEIKPGQAVEYPGLNISRLDGTSLVAFFNQKITLPQMLEEMMEARLNQQAKNDPELYNKLGNILQGIQNKLKGVQILPKGKTSFSRGDIVEAYSHLAVAEVIANPAYTSHLSQREQAVVHDVLGSVFRAQRYKTIAGAWLNYKESAEGKAYLENGGKDLVDIFSEAGFTFGKHMEAKQATEEQKMKALEARNFLPDFNAETKLLENKAEAEQKLAEVNAKEAQEPTVIPANESVTGEEIVITPELKEAEQAPAVARPDFVELVKDLAEARYDVTFYKESTASAQKRIEKWRSRGNEKMIEHEEKSIAYNQQKLEGLPQKIKYLEEAIANYNTSINAPNAVLTPEEQLLNKLRTPAATIRDFVTFFSKHRTTEANDIELGLHTKTQNGEDNPAYVMGKKIGNEVRSRSITTEEQYKNYFITSSVNEKITETAGELVTSTVLQQEATAAKKYAQTLRNNAKRSKGKLTQAQNAGGTLSLPAAPKWPTAPQKKNKHSAKQIVDILATTTSKDKVRYALNYVSQETQDGTVTYVSCDGRRISALSHKSKESNSKILLDPKTAEPAKEQVDYVGWRHVSRFDTPVIKTIDLAPMLALTKLRKRGKYHPTLSSDSATHKLIEIDIAGKHYTLNAVFLREAVEQLAALTKAYGFPSTVQIHDADIFVISATHGGLKWQCCIQPLTEVDVKTEHNIIFSETSAFIRGAGSHVSATEIEKLQKVYEIDEANAQDAENEAAELKQKAKDVAMLEEQLPPMEKHIRQAVGATRNFSFAKASSLARDFERGNISVLMPTIPQQDAKTKWGRDLFERISGLTLPGTPEGNKAMAEQWAAEQAAKGTPIDTSTDSSTSGANFSIQEAEVPVYTAINDNVGLQQHLNDIVEPIEINFTSAKKKGGDWVKEALDYYMQELAGQSLSIGNTGYTLHVKATKNRAKLATYNSNTQARSEAFKQIKEIIAKAYRLGSEHAESREKESKFRSNQIANTATFERFGYPVSIGGEVRMFWFTGQTKSENDTDVLFAESGLTEAQKGDTALTWSSQDATMPPSAITLGDALSNVKGKIKGVPQIIKNAHTANFSIQAASLPDRFAGHPLAERMSNFMRTEARRYERTLSKQTPGDAATNALFATQSIIHAVDKYVRNGEFKLPRESMIRLKHARALIDKYAQMMKSGKVRSFNKIDKAEQAELLAAMAEAAAGIDADAINAMTPEEYAALKAEVEAEMMPELYRKHARALADDVAKSNLPEKEKKRTLSALHRIIKEGKLAKNTTLDKPEQRQLTELVENEAQDAIEKEARNREFKLTADKIQQDAKERNERMVRVAATGRIGELLRDMLNETADIVDLYLKTELLKKLKRITDSVKIKRSPSKTLKSKMGAAEYRRMDAIVELMEMSARAKDNALGEIENARRILNESKGEIPEVAEGSLLWEIINNLNEQGISVSVDMLNIELNNREADVNVFANLDGMDYAEALNAARGLAGLIYFGRTAWQMKQAAEYERIKAFLNYFYEHTDSELGTSQAIDKGKKKKIGNIFNSSMNDAQLLFALAGHEGLRPVMDEMRQKLAMAQDARNLHIKSITNQIYATYARLIGMKPQTEAGYTDKQLREASNKFSMEFEKWNETGKPNVVREWIDNDGVLKKQEMELSRLQALDLILTYRQRHYLPNADKHGYTEAVLNKLEEYCGTHLMAMGEAFKRTIQNDGTAQVYEERTGIPMYKDPSYWPGSININTINLTSEEPLVNPYNPAGTYNRLKQRVKHTNEAKYQNAFEKWKHAIAEGANYIYLHPITNTLNRMLAHREFANRLHGLIGSDLFSQLRLMLNVLDSSTWQETALRDEANNWAASMLKATAPAVLARNPGTMARQLSAINNYAMLPGIRISRLPALIALIKQDKSAITLSDIMQLDSFRARYRDNAEVNDMLGLGANAKFSTYNKWAKAGMNIIDRLDIWSNAVSACLYYNMLYEQMREKNQGAANPLSEEEIRNICEQNVAQLLRLVAQPLEKANKSAMYWKYGNTWMGSIFLYMSTEMVNKTGMLRATYIKNKAEGMPFHKNAWQLIYKMGLGLGGMTFLIEAGLFLLHSGDLPDDEKEWLAALFSLAIYSAFGQYLSRIPFIGSVTDYYLSPYGQYTTNKNQQQNPALSIDQTSAKLLKMMSDNKHYSASEWQVAYTRFVRDLTAVSGLASGLVPQAQWISTTTATLQSLSAAMNTVYPVARSVQMDSWMRNITPDWYKPKKTKKRAKSALEEALTPKPEKKKGRKSK